MTKGDGTIKNPWKLKTPPGTSEYEMYRDVKDGKEVLVCTVGKTVLLYDSRAIKDLHSMLKKHGDWVELMNKSRQKRVQSRRGDGHPKTQLEDGMD